jgi:hypothetical protein
LDSFLDIVTNVAGVLILVAVVTVLSAGDISMSLGTPILHPAPAGAEPILFECKNQRISRLPERELNRQFDRLKRERGADKVTVDDVEQLLSAGILRDAAYRVRLRIVGGTPLILFEPRYPVQGETTAELQAPNSAYRSYLKGLDPEVQYLYFLVREDSFDVFREARKVAAGAGLQVGWHPKQSHEPLLFGGPSPGAVSTDPQR